MGAIWLAHGIQGRADLPVPAIAFYWASAIVLVVSFVGLALGWRRPVLASILERRARIVARGGRVRAAMLALGRVASVAVLLLVVATASFGSEDLNANFAPIFVFVVWWIGIAICAATVGDVWRALHPVAALARMAGFRERAVDGDGAGDGAGDGTGSAAVLPAGAGVWFAAAGLFAFTWLELVYPTAANVRLLGALVVGWTVVTFAAMSRYGIDAVLDRVEPFAVYTRVLGTLGVVGTRGRTGSGVERRPPVLGVLRLGPSAGLPAFVGLLIGSVSYDGLSRTAWWKQRLADATLRLVDRGLAVDTAQLLVGTLGFMAMVVTAIIAFVSFARIAGAVGQLPARTAYGSIEQAFAPSLVPIAVVYVVAHYFSYFWFQSQHLVRLASDPFGRGSNLFGTAGFAVDFSTLSAEAIWIVQVTAIVVGHVVALVLAHDRALELEAEGGADARGVRSQWPMLALMVLFTIGGLFFLSEGLNA